MALTTLYGRCREIEESIDLAREHTSIPNYMDGTCTYSLWWMIILKDYTDRVEAGDFALRQLDYLEALTEHNERVLRRYVRSRLNHVLGGV